MSNVALPSGDDHAEAARKHLADAAVLLEQNRPDGAAYLSGYVVECALKTLCLVERLGSSPVRGHDISSLGAQVAAAAVLAGARTAKYLGVATRNVATASIAAWRPDLRYRAPHITLTSAQEWYTEAEAIFNETIGAMYLDGVLG
jgi:HEPN domain-containing protein